MDLNITFSTEEECKSYLFEKFNIYNNEINEIYENISIFLSMIESPTLIEEYTYTSFKEDIQNYISTQHPLLKTVENPHEYRKSYMIHMSKWSKIGHYFVILKYVQKKVKQNKKNRISTLTFQSFDFEDIQDNISAFDEYLHNIERNVMSNFTREEQTNYFNLTFQDKCHLEYHQNRNRYQNHSSSSSNEESKLPLFWSYPHSHLHSTEELNGFELNQPSPEGIMIDNFFKPIFQDVQHISFQNREVVPMSYQDILNQIENTNIPPTTPRREIQSNIDDFDNFYKLHNVSEEGMDSRPQNIDDLINERKNMDSSIVNRSSVDIEIEFDTTESFTLDIEKNENNEI